MARRRRNPEIIAGRVNADGSIAAGDGFTVARASAGNWTIIFQQGFRLTAVSVTIASIVAAQAPMANPQSGDRFGLLTNNSAGTATDIAFSFVAVGVQQ